MVSFEHPSPTVTEYNASTRVTIVGSPKELKPRGFKLVMILGTDVRPESLAPHSLKYCETVKHTLSNILLTSVELS